MSGYLATTQVKQTSANVYSFPQMKGPPPSDSFSSTMSNADPKVTRDSSRNLTGSLKLSVY